MLKVKLLAYILIFALSHGIAQTSVYEHDTTNIAIHLKDSFGLAVIDNIDTSLNDIHRYNIQNLDNVLGFTGGYGNASYTGSLSELSLRTLGVSVNRYNSLLPMDLGYYQVKKPFTRLTYHNGPKREQEIELIHTQNVNDRFNVAISFRRFSSDGFYQRQRSIHSNAGTTLNYVSRTGTYRLKGLGIINIGFSQENGGMIFDTTFTNNTESNRLGVGTYLTNAENQYDTRFYQVEQDLDISNWGASLNPSKITLEMNNSFELVDLRFEDTSPVDSFYAQYDLPESSFIGDKVQRISFSSDYGISISQAGEYKLRFSGLNKIYRMRILSGDTFMIDNGARVDGYLNNQNSSLVWKGEYYVSGFSSNTYHIGGSYTYKLSDSTKSMFRFSGFTQRNRPAWEQLFYESSVESYRNNLEDIYTTELKLEWLSQKNSSIGVKYTSTLNHTYFDSDLEVLQFEKGLNLFSAFANYDIMFLKPIFIQARLTYRNVLTNNAPINLPELQSSTTVYIEKPFFKKALRGRLGFDLYHFTSFFGNGYMPLGRRFYLQNEDETGGFVIVDAFLSLQIGRARGFVKFSNVTEEILTPYNYILTPGYPLQDRAMRFGISWDLMN